MQKDRRISMIQDLLWIREFEASLPGLQYEFWSQKRKKRKEKIVWNCVGGKQITNSSKQIKITLIISPHP